jgi:uncharacterized protein with PIN domain
MAKAKNEPSAVKLTPTDRSPICPYCEKELDRVHRHKGSLNLLRHLDLFACPHCRKVLGTAVTFK